MHSKTYRHWKLETDEQGFAWLHFDKAESSANVLSSEVLEELDDMLGDVEGQPPKGLLIVSDKPKGFIAGADVTEFATATVKQNALGYIQRAQAIFDRLEALPCPSVALIHGFCLGGGLELALACDYRVATDDGSTRIGLPEVKLGIHPGFGGSMRLNRLIGAIDAMSLMLAGRTVDGHNAGRLGIVDEVVPLRHLKTAGISLLTNRPSKHRPSRLKALASAVPVRPLLAMQFRRQVAKKAKPEHYPAPYALIDVWQRSADSPRRMLRAEAESVARLITDDTAQNLVRVFFLQERMKGLGNDPAYRPRHVHVIGAGAMGGDIAAWCALQGLRVTLQDREPKFIAPAVKRAGGLFDNKLRQAHLNMAARDRLIPDHKGLGIEKADIVIEAIVENAEIKQSLYRDIEPRLKDGAILASNTSSIPLETLGLALQNPERLIGLHFFNPVAKMQLVEIVCTAKTDPELLKRASTFVKNIRRLPLPVKSSPGFLVNRVLMPYLLESVEMLGEGLPAETIDRAATDFGMPMGPILLADAVGLDICLSVADILGRELGLAVPDKLREAVAAGHLGKKSDKGFYDYAKGRPVIRPARQLPATKPEQAERLIMRILNESVACLRKDVIADADLLDAGMIFGTGFAPFRGGPMHYMQQRGKQEVMNTLTTFQTRFGERFTPDSGWADIDDSGGM